MLRFLVGDADGQPRLVQWTRHGPRGQVATVTAEYVNGRTREIQRVEHTPNEPCPRCGEPHLAHRVCASCGYYKDRLVIEPKEEETP